MASCGADGVAPEVRKSFVSRRALGIADRAYARSSTEGLASMEFSLGSGNNSVEQNSDGCPRPDDVILGEHTSRSALREDAFGE